MKRVLITGAAGFGGQYLSRALIRKGYQVFGTYLDLPRGYKAAHPFFQADLRCRSTVQKLLRKVRPDFLFHLAAQSSARRSWQFPDETFSVNTGGTLNLLNAVRQESPHTKILFASSVQVYGKIFHEGRRVSEEGAVWPDNPYASSKRTAELSLLDFYTRFGVKSIILRLVNHTWPGQDPHFVFSDWSRQIAAAEKKGRPGKLEVGNLRVVRDFLHVRDVVSAYLTVMAKGKPGEIYNTASGSPVSLQKYAGFLVTRAQVKFQIVPVKARMRGGEPEKTLIRVSKLKALGWKPQYSVYEAIEDSLADWRKKLSHE